MKLFIDTTNWQLTLLLINQQNKVVDQLIVKDTKKVSEIALASINQLLANHNLNLHMITKFYVTKGPGSYTGVRVGLAIVKTLKSLNKKIEVFLISSLLFQVGTQKAISVFDARGGKNYIGVYAQAKAIEPEHVGDKNALDILVNKYSDFKIVKDYEQTDFALNFLQLINNFELIEKVEKISPLYIKSFI